MPNDYFQFQQFRIAQNNCAMKVSTDACLLGAVADASGASRVLDVGTGTGLLALMLAQRFAGAEIEALEIDPAAAAQAAANVRHSPWAGRVRVQALSLAAYAATQPAGFGHIVCNPPFFRGALPAPGAARRLARHAEATSLTFEALAQFAADFLLPDGALTVLLPPPEMLAFELVAQAAGLHPQRRLLVQHRPQGRVTRHIVRFGRAARQLVETEALSIRTADDGDYSARFRALLAGFYLALPPKAGAAPAQ